MIWSLLTSLGPWLLGLGAALLAAIGYGRAQRQHGAAEVRAEVAETAVEAHERMAEVQDIRDGRDRLRKGKL